MLSEVGLDFERWGSGQQRAITLLWAATQVAARVVQRAFVEIYTSLPDSGNGHTSLKDFCCLVGRSSVYLELLDEGYMLDVLTSSPRETAFLDLKVTRKVLEKVIVDRFSKDKCGKLMFEVRQLVYLRNDLCHQLLPALTLEQYLTRMKQLETRLCIVISEAASIAGASHTPDKALQDIRALFAELAHEDESKAESDTQTDPLPSPDTTEKSTQARIDPQEYALGEGMFGDGSQSALIHSPKDPADPERFSVFSSFQGLVNGMVKSNEKRKNSKSIKSEKQGKQKKQRQGKHEECCDACPFSPQSPVTSSHPHTGRMLCSPHGVPGHNICRANLAASKRLTYDAVTINHVFAQPPQDDREPLTILLSLVLKVVLFIGAVVISLLPVALALLRVVLDGVKYSWARADGGCRYLRYLFFGPRYQKVVILSELVLTPRLETLDVRAPGLEPLHCKSFGKNHLKDKWKLPRGKFRRS